MKLTLIQAAYLWRAMNGPLDVLDPEIRSMTVHALARRELLSSGQGLMGRYFRITERGRQEIARYKGKDAAA